MTDLNAKEILRREYLRIVDRLNEVDPVANPKLYKELLTMIGELAYLPDFDEAAKQKAEAKKVVEGFFAPETDEPEQKPVLVNDPEPTEDEPDPEPEEAEEPEVDTPTLTKETVRAALAKSRKSGVNVTALLQEIGYDNFSAVPAAKYGEIMARLGDA